MRCRVISDVCELGPIDAEVGQRCGPNVVLNTKVSSAGRRARAGDAGARGAGVSPGRGGAQLTGRGHRPARYPIHATYCDDIDP